MGLVPGLASNTALMRLCGQQVHSGVISQKHSLKSAHSEALSRFSQQWCGLCKRCEGHTLLMWAVTGVGALTNTVSACSLRPHLAAADEVHHAARVGNGLQYVAQHVRHVGLRTVALGAAWVPAASCRDKWSCTLEYTCSALPLTCLSSPSISQAASAQ